MAELRIVTINTGKCDGPYQALLRWLTSELGALQPDFIACQEVFISQDGAQHTAAEVAAALGMHRAVTRARFKVRICEGRLVLGWSGLALLSRRPWREQATIRLPADERDGERIALVGATEHDGRRLVVGSVHLTHLRDADALRRAQLAATLDHPLFAGPDSVRLLCGDFNTSADGPVLAPILAGEGAQSVRDTYLLGGGREPRGTLAPRRGEPERTASPCIDFILSIAATEAHPAFRASAVVLDRPRPGTGVYPSDHFGVITTMIA